MLTEATKNFFSDFWQAYFLSLLATQAFFVRSENILLHNLKNLKKESQNLKKSSNI